MKPWPSLVHDLDRDDWPARNALKAAFVRWEGLFAEGLRRVADNRGLVADTDPAVPAGGLLAAYRGGVLLADARGDVEPLRRALESVLMPHLCRLSRHKQPP